MDGARTPAAPEPDSGFQGSVPLTIELGEGQTWEAAQNQTSPQNAKVHYFGF